MGPHRRLRYTVLVSRRHGAGSPRPAWGAVVVRDGSVVGGGDGEMGTQAMQDPRRARGALV